MNGTEYVYDDLVAIPEVPRPGVVVTTTTQATPLGGCFGTGPRTIGQYAPTIVCRTPRRRMLKTPAIYTETTCTVVNG